jgi:hypothetical protein
MNIVFQYYGVHKKQVTKLLDLPFEFMHLILYTKVLHTWEFPV